MPLRAALLDMDGLLIDTEPMWQEVEVRELSALGVPITRQECLNTVGLRIDEAMGYWHARRPWDGCTLEELCGRVTQGVINLVAERGNALPGVYEAVEFLRSRGLKLGVASSSRQVLIDAVLHRLDLGSFDAVVSAEHERYGKPHPAVYLTAAEQLGVAPTECLALEDSYHGVLAAKAARMTCIAVPWPEWADDPRFVIADAKLSSLTELDAELLDRLGHVG